MLKTFARIALAAALILGLFAAPAALGAADSAGASAVKRTGLPLPRFVTLRSAEVNVRTPSTGRRCPSTRTCGGVFVVRWRSEPRDSTSVTSSWSSTSRSSGDPAAVSWRGMCSIVSTGVPALSTFRRLMNRHRGDRV